VSEDYEKLLSMWRDEKQRRQFAETEIINQVEKTKKEADELMIKKITMYEDKLNRKDEDITRLVEEKNNFEIISKSHKELNGELRKELDEVKEDNRKLSKQIEAVDKVKELRKKGLI
jgi:uncharacterized protein YoxC